jgi:putative membrane protein
VIPTGTQPLLPELDPRVTFAAERTLLAWVRTGLALMGFGFVVARFGLFLRTISEVRGGAPESSRGPSLWLGATLVVLGVVACLLAGVKHMRVLKALRRGVPYRPPAWSLEVAVTAVLALLGLGMTAYLVFWSH